MLQEIFVKNKQTINTSVSVILRRIKYTWQAQWPSCTPPITAFISCICANTKSNNGDLFYPRPGETHRDKEAYHSDMGAAVPSDHSASDGHEYSLLYRRRATITVQHCTVKP